MFLQRLSLCLAAALAAFGAAPAMAAGPPGTPKRDGPALHRFPAPQPIPAQRKADPSTVLVRLRDAADVADAARVARDHGAALGDAVAGTRYRVVRADPARLGRVRAGLRDDARVAAVEPNRIRTVATATPSDPFFRKSEAQAYLHGVRAPVAWTMQQAGADAVVAVVDTGVDARHPDLAGRVLPGRDFIDGDAVAQDPNGHGTMVAGAAAAISGNTRGIAGVASGASVLPVRTLDRFGQGTDADLAAGITWAADHGADVINVSATGRGASGALAEAVAYAGRQGALVVAAAGNSRIGLAQYPAAIPAVVAVGAADMDGDVTEFSTSGPWVDLVAPGVEVISTDRTDRSFQDGSLGIPYALGTGTSYAAPIVAAAAVLVRARHPDWGPQAVAAHLAATAADRGPRGRDDHYGAGGLDIAAALGAAPRPVVAPPRADTDGVPARARTLGFDDRGLKGVLSPEGDVDHYAIRISEPGWYAAVASRTSEPDLDHPAWRLDPQVEILDPALRPIARDDDNGIGEDVNGNAAPEETGTFYARRAGLYYASVRNANGGRPTYSITATKTELNQPDTRFRGYQRYHEPDEARGVAIADVTGDGRADTLTATNAGLVVHPQDEDGWLRTHPPLPAHHVWISDVVAGDVDADGDLDAVLTNMAGLDVYLNGGKGLRPARLLPHAGHEQADVVDLDADGRAEIVAAGRTGVFRYDRAGAGWKATRLMSRRVTELEIGDVTGDGRLDLVTTDWWGVGLGVDVRAQRADRTFAAPVRYGGASSSLWCCQFIEVADVTGDGRADVVSTQGAYPDESVAVRAQTTAGTLAYPATVSTARSANTVEAADVDGDGRRDVVVTHGDELVSVHFQTSAGRLGPGHEYTIPYTNHAARGLAIGDVNSDGAADIVQAADSEGLAVLRQQLPGGPVDLPTWVRSTSPLTHATGVDASATPSVTLARPLDPASATSATVRLTDATGGQAVATSIGYDAATGKLTADPAAALEDGRTYLLTLDGLRDTRGRRMTEPYTVRFTVGAPPPDRTAPDTRLTWAPRRRTVPPPVIRAAASEPHVRYECSMDDGPWNPCAGSDHLVDSSYGLGTHTFRTRAVDAAGNTDPTPAVRTYEQVEVDNRIENEQPDEAFVLEGAGGKVAWSNVSAYKWPEFEPSPGENGGGAMVWWRWTAPAAMTATFSTAGSDFDTLLGVYDWTGSYDDPLVEVASNDDASASRTTSRVTFEAVAGRTYWIAVDGFNPGPHNASAESGSIALSYNVPEPAQPARVLTGIASATSPSATTLNGTLDTAGAAGTYRFEYGPTTAYGTQTPAVSGRADGLLRDVQARISGLTPARTYHYRLLYTTAAGTTVAGADQTVRTPAAPPGISTLAATDLRPGAATLHATAAPGENERYTVSFEYGTTIAYGMSAQAEEPAWGDTHSSKRIERLEGGTTYHYRAIVVGESGSVVRGADRTFTTPARGAPLVERAGGAAARHSSAEVVARVDSNGAPTTAWIEYGTTAAYGSRGPVADAGLGTDGELVELEIDGLEPVTTYHYRVVAQNASGTTRSADETLTTAPPPPAVTALAPTDLSPTSATLNARVDPHGLQTRYGFGYRRAPWQPSAEPYESLTATTGLQAVSSRQENRFVPDTEYVLVVVAESSSGRTRTPPLRFRTPRGAPLIDRAPTIREQGETELLIDAPVNPAGPLTAAWFEFGTASVDEHMTAKIALGSGTVALNARQRITGLAPRTTYLYRVVAKNALGTTHGATQSVTTGPVP